MAATFTPLTIQEMDTFLKRAFRALNPVKGAQHGEVTYDLFLSESKRVGIRVWTTIPAHGDMSRTVGADAIRVIFFHFAKGHPLEKKGARPIVKRTQNWRDALKDRIEDVMELYDDNESYWER
jgi:hypothetical protein